MIKQGETSWQAHTFQLEVRKRVLDQVCNPIESARFLWLDDSRVLRVHDPLGLNYYHQLLEPTQVVH